MVGSVHRTRGRLFAFAKINLARSTELSVFFSGIMGFQGTTNGGYGDRIVLVLVEQ